MDTSQKENLKQSFDNVVLFSNEALIKSKPPELSSISEEAAVLRAEGDFIGALQLEAKHWQTRSDWLWKEYQKTNQRAKALEDIIRQILEQTNEKS